MVEKRPENSIEDQELIEILRVLFPERNRLPAQRKDSVLMGVALAKESLREAKRTLVDPDA